MTTLIKDLIEIPERIHHGDFVLKLTDGVTEAKAAETLRNYVVTPQLAGLVMPRSIPDNRVTPGTSERGQCRACGAPLYTKAAHRASSTTTKRTTKGAHRASPGRPARPTSEPTPPRPRRRPGRTPGATGVDWQAAGRKAWETRKRNAAAKAASA